MIVIHTKEHNAETQPAPPPANLKQSILFKHYQFPGFFCTQSEEVQMTPIKWVKIKHITIKTCSCNSVQSPDFWSRPGETICN